MVSAQFFCDYFWQTRAIVLTTSDDKSISNIDYVTQTRLQLQGSLTIAVTGTVMRRVRADGGRKTVVKLFLLTREEVNGKLSVKRTISVLDSL